MQALLDVLNAINGVLWHTYVLYVLLGVGILFTVWSGFGQYRAITHGTAVVRGKYDDKDDPGAINHFQALSTALSATVGLGNIAGVAIAISVGGPGAVFWMWVTGLVGMCLKLTEVTQAMMFRDTTDPENPRGGAMWVCKKGFAKINPALAPLGVAAGAIFCITLLISTVTGGNIFQAWNVADIGFAYFGIPKFVSTLVLTLGVGVVIVGGIKRIGDVAGRIVPFMCVAYVLAGLYVIVTNAGEIPAMFALIFREAFNPSEASGAFLGGAMGYGFLKGMQRALFSNEAGQGSAPIAHAAAKTDEPVREGVVAGLEPFIDTLVVCTITAMVILLSGAWNRAPALAFKGEPPIAVLDAEGKWEFPPTAVYAQDENEAAGQLRTGNEVYLVVEAGANEETGGKRHKIKGKLSGDPDAGFVALWDAVKLPEAPTIAIEGVYFDFNGATLTAKAYDRVLPGLGLWVVPIVAFLFAFSTIISWSYYGEQGVTYLFGQGSVLPYRIVYCLLVLVSSSALINSKTIEDISTLGTGVMLWANIPIMLIFGPMAMKEYHNYMGRLKRGEMKGHAYPKVTDVVEGKDVE
ncbi:MAG: amino acid carrier protein [Phycisphaerales bacterium]|jgi:AGCS family alanine or glycine:cation symporter|nr:amino acid carrier protein [Phycisphaerales bacterium]